MSETLRGLLIGAILVNVGPNDYLLTVDARSKLVLEYQRIAMLPGWDHWPEWYR